MAKVTARILGPRDGKAGFLGSIGVRFMLDGVESDGLVSVVEHPLSPREGCAPRALRSSWTCLA